MRSRWFSHVDMDAFYASVEILDRPELAELPVAVGGKPGERGVIAAASYAARKFGVHSAMPTAQALRLCPELVLLPGRMARYQELSAQIMQILRDASPAVEPLSLDEASLDLSGCARLHGIDEAVDGGREGWTRFAQQLQQRIHKETGLSASVGLGETRRIAKIASDHRKPAGVVVVPRGEGRAFLADLPVEKLRGVGPKMAERLRAQGFRYARNIASTPRNQLQQLFGKAGSALLDMVEARDVGTVHPDRREKSVGHETTFARDLIGMAALEPVLSRLSEKVSRRLHQRGLQGRVVQLKIRDRGFHTFTRRHSIATPTDSAPCIRDEALRLLHAMKWEQVPVRLIGVTVAGLTESRAVQGELFATAEQLRQPRIDQVVDDIHDKFGSSAFLRGRSLLATGVDRTPWGATLSKAGQSSGQTTGLKPGRSDSTERIPQ
jgi:DNA polymerase IV